MIEKNIACPHYQSNATLATVLNVNESYLKAKDFRVSEYI